MFDLTLILPIITITQPHTFPGMINNSSLMLKAADPRQFLATNHISYEFSLILSKAAHRTVRAAMENAGLNHRIDRTTSYQKEKILTY
jgi:hypothetical protein